MKIGDKLVCDDGKTYTLVQGNKAFNIAIIDKNGVEVNAYHLERLNECDPNYQGVQKLLNVGLSSGWSKGIYTKVIRIEEC